ncbi:MAG: ribbon-helix-helix protein, CopG family [Chloroflexi bacterium]|nr:ribbon-helix-helix protein, CopG family [Chloroflexota bacterium]
MPKTARIAISLPEEVLRAVERERAESGESRSALLRRAIELLLRQRREREISEAYTRAYKELPETEEEIAAARRAASTILAESPGNETGGNMVG